MSGRATFATERLRLATAATAIREPSTSPARAGALEESAAAPSACPDRSPSATGFTLVMSRIAFGLRRQHLCLLCRELLVGQHALVVQLPELLQPLDGINGGG